jgi:hypothetical protein
MQAQALSKSERIRSILIYTACTVQRFYLGHYITTDSVDQIPRDARALKYVDIFSTLL